MSEYDYDDFGAAHDGYLWEESTFPGGSWTLNTCLGFFVSPRKTFRALQDRVETKDEVEVANVLV